ncbi:MAG: MaoC/PaaZ C-terminal domain-containing protein [Proteobacteria bacterium]|nr:MaoC/PaaZ C-terminal domain-containing protein [Pseudomonadota bacterium]
MPHATGDQRSYFERFSVGHAWQTPAHRVGAEEVRAYAETWDPLPIHIDEQSAAASPHGGLIASGEHTFVIMRRALWDLGLLGQVVQVVRQDELRFLAPVRIGDWLVTEATCIDTQPAYGSGTGLVTLQLSVTNQDGTLVLKCTEMLEVSHQPKSAS